MANKPEKLKKNNRKPLVKKEEPVGDTPYTQSEWNKKIREYYKTHKPHPILTEIAGTLRAGKKTLKQLMDE